MTQFLQTTANHINTNNEFALMVLDFINKCGYTEQEAEEASLKVLLREAKLLK